MLFNSFEYTFFLAFITVAYFSLPFRHRIWLLLVASYFFYMQWRWEYAFLILFQTVVNYGLGWRIGITENTLARRFYLVLALVSTLGLLFFFKYYNFTVSSVNVLGGLTDGRGPLPLFEIILPVGISFFTFQALGYTIDVYRRQVRVETHFGRFATYVAFFPQLVAGPIERATTLLGQFGRENRFDVERLASGLRLILWGLFKKMVIADRLAVFVDRVYDAPGHYSGATLLLATYFFAFQIYCDFSAYSDIARGSARILGYDLMRNFNLPYFARSIGEFWQRWHISLSTWFRDYVYFPLGGNRVGPYKWFRNILVVFLLSGLWHGAAWTFVIWGGLHGFYYLLERVLKRPLGTVISVIPAPHWLVQTLQRLMTFHLVVIAWVFFRAQSLGDARLIFERLLTDFGGPLYLGPSFVTTFLSIGLIGLLLLVEFVQYNQERLLPLLRSPLGTTVRYGSYVGLILCITLLAKSTSEFIYFQF